MPVKRRKNKVRHARLEWAEWLSLGIGDGHRGPAFASDEDRREAWEAHRERLMGEGPRGKRPAAWWDYDSSQPRDPDIHQTLQLFRMGELAGNELDAVMADWSEWAAKARRLHFARHGGSINPGPEAEAHWRAWAGIPDELFREGDDR